MEDWFKWEGWAQELIDLGKLALWMLGLGAALGGAILRGAVEAMHGKGHKNTDTRLAMLVMWSGIVLLVIMAVTALLPEDTI